MIPDLPALWSSARLGLCLKRRRETVMPATLTTDFVNVLGLEDIQDGGRGGIAIKKMRPAAAVSLKTRFYKGDILYGKLRPYLNKVSIAPDDGLCSTEIWAFETESFADPYFVYAFLSSRAFVERVSGMAKGANLPRLDLEVFEGLDIPLPPLSEQRRIVAILQEASQVESLRLESQEIEDRIRASLFHFFFLRLSVSSVFTVGSLLVEKPNYGTMEPATTDDNGILCLRVGNIQDDRLQLQDRKFVEESKIDLRRHIVREGDMLFARAIGSLEHLGKSIIVPKLCDGCAFDSHLMRVRVDTDRVRPEYLHAYFRSQDGRANFLRNTRKSAVQFNINTEEFARIAIPLPEIKLQDEYLSARELVEECHSLSSDVGVLASGLKDSLMASAFTGRLTIFWRIANAQQLLVEAQERDKAVKFLETTPTANPLSSTVESQDKNRIEGSRTELTRDQQRVLAQFERTQSKRQPLDSGERNEGKVCTADRIARVLVGPLHDNVQAVESDLAVLVARGLVTALSLEQRTPDTDETVYGNCYRLPVADPAADEDEVAQSSGGVDGTRDQEILRLLGNRKREETAP
jgi:type I restriction enzyme, S subunit